MISFSIITCTYNAAPLLQRTIDSVKEQTYPLVEHLFVDGLSKDDTMTMVERYRQETAQSDSRHTIVAVSERDKGLYDAMNKSLKMVTGDYLLFLNAGDTFPSADTLEAIAATVGEGETLPGVLYGDTDVVDDHGSFLRHRHHSAPKQLTSASFRHGMLVCHQAFYALTSIARETPYNLRYRYSADVDWCIRIMKQAEKEGRPMRNANRVVAHFLDGGMTTANHRASLIERFRIMTTHYGLLATIAEHVRKVFGL